jgi:hypothetical protein
MTFKNYVCTICAQDFTRKYSALRHNRTLHQGRANIVRLLEYIVGRIRGEYSLADPMLFRKNRWRSPYGNLSNFPFVSVAHDKPGSPVRENMQSNEYKMKQNSHDESVKGFHHSPKLNEVKSVFASLYPGVDSDIFVRKLIIDLINNGGNEAVLDNYLKKLRLAKAILSPQTSSKGAEPLSSHFKLGKLVDLPPNVINKLEEIHIVMSNTQHSDFVFETVERLAQKYRVTKDPNILDVALDYYRSGPGSEPSRRYNV